MKQPVELLGRFRKGGQARTPAGCRVTFAPDRGFVKIARNDLDFLPGCRAVRAERVGQAFIDALAMRGHVEKVGTIDVDEAVAQYRQGIAPVVPAHQVGAIRSKQGIEIEAGLLVAKGVGERCEPSGCCQFWQFRRREQNKVGVLVAVGCEFDPSTTDFAPGIAVPQQ